MAILFSSSAWAQFESDYNRDGDKVCVKRYDENGTLRQEGCFVNNKADGKWTQYDIQGEVEMVGYYNQDSKEGKWYAFKNDKDTMYEVVYHNNKVTQSNLWKIHERNLTAGNN